MKGERNEKVVPEMAQKKKKFRLKRKAWVEHEIMESGHSGDFLAQQFGYCSAS